MEKSFNLPLICKTLFVRPAKCSTERTGARSRSRTSGLCRGWPLDLSVEDILFPTPRLNPTPSGFTLRVSVCSKINCMKVGHLGELKELGFILPMFFFNLRKNYGVEWRDLKKRRVMRCDTARFPHQHPS